jgi:hypothetical protein
MAKEKMVIGGSDNVTASQLKELFSQIDMGALSGSQINALLDHRNPFPWFEYIGDFSFGNFRTIMELEEKIIETASICAGANQGMDAVDTSFSLSKKKTLQLIRTSVSHFGLQAVTYSQISERIVGSTIERLGVCYKIGLCPQETAGVLLIDYYSRKNHIVKLKNYESMIIMSEPVRYSWDYCSCKSLLTIKRVEDETRRIDRPMMIDGKISYGDELNQELTFHETDWLVFALYEI